MHQVIFYFHLFFLLQEIAWMTQSSNRCKTLCPDEPSNSIFFDHAACCVGFVQRVCCWLCVCVCVCVARVRQHIPINAFDSYIWYVSSPACLLMSHTHWLNLLHRSGSRLESLFGITTQWIILVVTLLHYCSGEAQVWYAMSNIFFELKSLFLECSTLTTDTFPPSWLLHPTAEKVAYSFLSNQSFVALQTSFCTIVTYTRMLTSRQIKDVTIVYRFT